MISAFPGARSWLACCCLLLLPTLTFAQAPRVSTLSGVVKDANGDGLGGAALNLLSAKQATVATAHTDADGKFELRGVTWGTYELAITQRGFAPRRVVVSLPASASQALEITLTPSALTDEVSVTAEYGVVVERDSTPQKVNVINESKIAERAKSVLAQVGAEEPGTALQRTSPTIGAIYVRGLTGNKVNVFVDGVRMSNSAARGGINTFFNLNDASNLRSVEVLRGPNSAQFGSDALGGSVQLSSHPPLFTADKSEWHGTFKQGFNSADLGYGGNFLLTYGRPKFAFVSNLSAHRSNTIRPGQGIDTHAAVTRFLGLPSTIFGTRMSDTAFTQYGGVFKLSYALAPTQQLSVHYQRGQQDGGKRYDQTLGGDGNLIADLRNLMLDFFYARYEKQQAGWFDNISLTYSLNSQREERVNQGGNGNPNGAITHQWERTTTNGVQFQAVKYWLTRNTLVVGGEFYHDFIVAPAFTVNPVTNVASVSRPRVPSRATYRSGGVFAQDIYNIIPERLRLVGSVRLSAMAYNSRATDSPLVNGQPLWPDDSFRNNNVTWRVGSVLTTLPGLNFSAHISRGFRTPHITDFGTLGITGVGFEVAAPDVANLNATIGSTADRNAVNTGVAVTQLKPESSLSYDFGAHYKHKRIDADVVFFINNIHDNIAKQTLILPPGAVGKMLGDQTITTQLTSGAVFVAASTNPVLVRTNFENVRYVGLEQMFEYKLTNALTFAQNFTYIHSKDLHTGLAPNIEGGTPAPQGWLRLRYQAAQQRFWFEPYVSGSLRNTRLSSLDLEDRRTGAFRSRGNIQNFFRNGATARSLIAAGADGRVGTADDILRATGETLFQVQDRVLGVGVAGASLFRAIPGFMTFNLRGGIRFNERHEMTFDFENLTDRNYRGISWGLDAPGRGVNVRYSYRF
jgi:outer membrane receptor for ferrienterochelin and colicin